MTSSEHPDPETLGKFALGRLEGKHMAIVEDHLRQCAPCGEAASRVPDDRLVTLLRVPADRHAMRKPGVLLLLFAIGVCECVIIGCSDGVGEPDLSPQAQARARLAFRKRFGDYGAEVKNQGGPRRGR